MIIPLATWPEGPGDGPGAGLLLAGLSLPQACLSLLSGCVLIAQLDSS